MLYFSICHCLHRLTLEEKGMLFESILDYAQTGDDPGFEDKLGVAWDFIRPQIDADERAYRKKCDNAQKAVEARWAGTK